MLSETSATTTSTLPDWRTLDLSAATGGRREQGPRRAVMRFNNPQCAREAIEAMPLGDAAPVKGALADSVALAGDWRQRQ
jgi:hypothetical protein